MKHKAFLFIFAALLKAVHSDGPFCNLTPIDGQIDWIANSYDAGTITDVESLNKEFTYEGALEINSTDPTDSPVLSVSIEDNKLVLKTNENFTKNVDEITPSQKVDYFTAGLQVNLKCDNVDFRLLFSLRVTDTNNHPPTFLKDSYEYTVPTPLVPVIDLTNFGEAIIAEDLDFSNTDITFTIDDDKFDISTETTTTDKQYRVVLKTKEFLPLSQDTTYTITAKDSKPPYNTGTTTITFKVDGSHSLPDIPTFDQPSYRYQYSEVDGKPTVTPVGTTPVSITVTTTDPDKTTLQLESNKYFAVEYNTTTNLAQIVSTGEKIDSTTERVIVLTLTVTLDSITDGSSQSIILINIPEENVITVPTFSKPYYTATYTTDTDPHEITLAEKIQVVNDGNNVKVTLTGDQADHFDITLNQDQSWKLSVKTNLDPDIIKQGKSIVLTLDAKVTPSGSVGDGHATLIIKLPEIVQTEDPQFSQVYYSGEYQVNEGKDTVKITDGPITITNSKSGDIVDVTLQSADSLDNFDLKQIGNTPSWDLIVKTDLDDTILSKKREIILTIKATRSDSDEDHSGYSTLVISLPEKQTIAVPKFSESYYSVNYILNDDNTGKVQLNNGPIQVTDGGDVSVTFVEKTDNFDIQPDTKNPGNYNLLIKSPLSDVPLKKGEDIILTVQAISQVDPTSVGYATLIIALPKPLSLKFTHDFYSGEYKVDASGAAVELTNGPIETTAFPDKTVNVKLSDNDLFVLTKKENTDGYLITVAQPVPNDKLITGEEYVLTLTAEIENDIFENVVSSTLKITVPKAQTAKFVKPQYQAKYTVDGENANVEVEKIDVTAADNLQTTIKLTGQYSANFQFSYNSDSQITVTTPLGPEIIDQYQELLLPLEVTYADADPSVEPELAVVVLKLPFKETPPTLKFSKPSYTLSYTVDGDKHSIDYKNQKITIVNDDENINVEISEGTYASNFKVTRDSDGTYLINIDHNLDDSVLKSETDILLTLKASRADCLDGFATILINLPKKELPAGPEFAKPSYLATYTIGEPTKDDSIALLEMITVIAEGTVTLAIQGTNSDHFKTVKEDDSYNVEIIKPLDSATLLQEVDIVLTLTATVDTNPDAIGYSTLVIKLPKKASAASFSKAYYNADYKINTDKDTIEMKGDPIELVGDNVDVTTVTLDAGEYKDYFVLSTSSPYTITLSKNLDAEVYNSLTEIVVTIVGSLNDISSLKTSAAVVIAMPKRPQPPRFSDNKYSATYDEELKSVTIDDGQVISVSDSDSAQVSVSEPYNKNFKATYNSDEKNYTIDVPTPLSNDVIDNNEEIYVTLVAKIDRAITDDRATLVIKMPPKSEDTIPEFSDSHYFAQYISVSDGTDTITIRDQKPITITSAHQSETDVKVLSPYDDNIEAYFENTWKLRVINDFNDTVLNLDKEYYVQLEASLKNSIKKGYAMVILSLPKQDKSPAPIFTQAYYLADYEIKDNTPKLTGDPVAIVQTSTSDLVEISLSPDYTDYFKITKDTKTKIWKVEPTDPITDEMFKTNTKLPVALTATLEGSVSPGTATFLITLKNDPVTFDKTYYDATYFVNQDKTHSIQYEDIIINDPSASVDIQSDHKANFNVDCSTGTCKLGIAIALDDTTLENEIELILVLQATKPTLSSITTATIVVSLPRKALKPAPEFTHTYYTAKYELNPDKVTIIGDPITIKNDPDMKVAVSVLDYTDYFTISKKEDHWELTLRKSLDPTILNSNNEIPVQLKGVLESSFGDAVATLLITLPEKSAIQFDKPYYKGVYQVIEGDDNDKITIDNILVNVDGVKVTTSGEYGSSFNVNCNAKECQLTVASDLPEEVLVNGGEILIVLEATKDGSNDKGTATVIISLPPHNPVEFSEIVYTANYLVADDGSASVDVENKPIKLENINDITNVELSLSGEYKDSFSFDKQQDHWDLKVVQNLPSNVVQDDVSILLDITTAGTLSAKASLVIKLPKNVASTVRFSENAYMATYNTDDNSLKIDKDIVIEGSSASDAIVTLLGEYKDLFNCNYKKENGKVEVVLKAPLSKDILENQVVISVDINAVKATDNVTATLVVKLPKAKDHDNDDDDDGGSDKTGLIAAVAVLAVMLVAALVGSAVFYYIKFKRSSSSYEDMDDHPVQSEHFKRNSNGIKNKFEHPTRRPTGVIKYPLNNENVGETTTEDEFGEKRKSVQFDVENIDEIKIDKSDEESDTEESISGNVSGPKDEENTSDL